VRARRVLVVAGSGPCGGYVTTSRPPTGQHICCGTWRRAQGGIAKYESRGGFKAESLADPLRYESRLQVGDKAAERGVVRLSADGEA
jgi:hypothetical protein